MEAGEALMRAMFRAWLFAVCPNCIEIQISRLHVILLYYTVIREILISRFPSNEMCRSFISSRTAEEIAYFSCWRAYADMLLSMP